MGYWLRNSGCLYQNRVQQPDWEQRESVAASRKCESLQNDLKR